MPLARLNDVYEPDLEGIGFGMLAGKRAIRCVVTDDALTDAIGGNPTLAQKLAWFGHNRSRVEGIASRLFDRGMPTEPQLLVGTKELNPHLFSGA